MTWLELEIHALDVIRAAAGLGANWFIQSTLLIAAGLWIGVLLRSKGSAVQSAVYRTTLVAVLACPLVSWGLSHIGASGWSLEMPSAYVYEQLPAAEQELASAPPTGDAEPASEFAAEPAAFEVAEPSDFVATHSVDQAPPDISNNAHARQAEPDLPAVQAIALPSPESEPVPEGAFHMHGFGLAATILTAAWLVASGWLLARLASSWRQLVRIRRGATRADTATRDACQQVATLFHVTPPDVLHSPFLPSPCLAGLRRPAVLLPDVDVDLPVRDVLIHELAHLARGDCYWNLLRRIGTAVLFFQPLMWILSRRLDSTAEEVCDDYVVEFGGDRREYAHRLVNIAELSIAPIAAAGVGIVSLRSMLAARVARIMDTSRSLSTRIGSLLLATVLLAGLLATLLVGLVGVEPDRVVAEGTSEQQASDDASAADDLPKATEDGDSAPEDEDVITVRGTVISPDGKPFGDATVQVLRRYWDPNVEKKPLATTTSQANGRFTISFRKSQFNVDLRRADMWKEATIVASSRGYGPDFVALRDRTSTDDLVLRLVRDDVPVNGRLVDLEGNPLAGVTVRVGGLIAADDENLTPWLDAVRRDELIWQAANTHLHKSTPYKPADLPNELVTDADGRFRLTGAGRERRINLEFEGPTVARSSAVVVTRKMPPLSANSGPPGSTRSPKETIYGADFELALMPTQPIVGTVRDAATGAPLAGVEVHSYRMTEFGLSAAKLIRVTSDEDGRYRLVGMPKGSGRQIIAVPNDEQPYLMREFDVPDGEGLEAVECNLDLHRGVWITGRITDKQSGKPVGAPAEVWMHYLPFRDNPFAQALPEYDSNSNTDGYHDRYQVRADGTYRLVGLPGRAIVGIQCWQLGYPDGMGSELIAGIDEKTGHFNTFTNQVPPSRKWPTAMKEVNIAEGPTSIELNFELNAGRSLQFIMVDSAGNEIPGVSVRGAKGHGSASQEFETANVEAIGFESPLKRTMLFHHKQRNIGRVIWAEADDGSEKTIRVTLEPCATIRGRLIDDNEVPLTGAMIRLAIRPGGDFEPELKNVATDSDGRFEHTAVLPGADYAVFAESTRFGFTAVTEKLAIEPGETIDLGTVDVTKKERPEPKRTPAAAPQAAALPDDSMHRIQGRVEGPDGQPIAGATVFADWVFVGGRWPRPRNEPSQHFEHSIVAKTTSDVAGNFALTFSKQSPREGRLSHGWHVVAFADGYGPAWKRDVHLLKDSSPTLQLTRDLPVRGRVIDLEGKPVAGVNVRLHELRPSQGEEALADWIREAQQKSPPPKIDEYYFGSGQHAGPFPTTWDDGGLAHASPALPSDTTTGADGRFTLKNLGENRLATIEIDGPSIAKTYLPVVTRDMKPVSARPLNMIGLRADTHYGREFEFVAEPTQPIVGKVTDADTGQPLPDAEVRIGQFAAHMFSQTDFLTTRTDENGNYRLAGAPQGGGHRLEVDPGVDQPYFPTTQTLPAVPGSFDSVTCDFVLQRGQWIAGKVTDASSQQPIVDATVHYLPLRSNSLVTKYPNYDPRITGSAPRDRFRTSPDGSFRVLAIPGGGILAAIAENKDRHKYASLTVEEVPKHLVGEGGNLNAFHPWTITGYHALREVEILESADDTPYSLQFKPGLTSSLKLVDAAGAPVEGTRVLGRVFPPSFEEAQDPDTVEVIGLRSNEERIVVLLHPERRIGKALTVSPGDATTVTLEPCAVARGRLVDEDGQPLGQVTVSITLDGPDNWHRGLLGTSTDADGRFEVLLPPGMTYHVAHYSENGPNFSADCQARAGEVFELGDVPQGAKLTVEQTEKLVTTNGSGEAQNKVGNTDVTPTSNGSVAPVNTTEKVNTSIVQGNSQEQTHVRGRVIGPDGEPIAGAKVSFSDDAATEQHAVTSGANGRFEIAFDKTKFTKPDWHAEPWRLARLVATAEGFATTWVEGNELTGDTELTLQLKRDSVPVRGQILSLEGQPVPHAKLVIWDIHQPRSGNLDGMFASLRESPVSMQLQVYRNREMTWFPGRSLELNVTRGTFTRDENGANVTADAEGRFEFTGIGPERLLRGRIEGPNIQSLEISIVTRSKVDDRWKREPLNQNARMRLESGDWLAQIYPSTFEHFAGPSMPIVGQVLDRATSKPILGIGVSGRIRGAGDHASSVTDENGRYQLTGLSADGTLQLYVGPADGGKAPYMGVDREFQLSAGSPPKPELTEFKLTRGLVVRGTVTDAVTSKPVKARVEYLAHGSNPRVGELGDELWPYGDAITNDQGEFAIAVLPGPGALAATTRLASNVPDRYRPAEAEDFGLPLSERGWISTANHGIIMPVHYKAAKFLDLQRDEKSSFVSLTVKPISDFARVQCVDEQGRPLKGVSVIGHLPWSGKHPIIPHGGLEVGKKPGNYIEIAGLDEKGRQPAVFLHRENKTAAVLFPTHSARQPRLADLKQDEQGVYQLPLMPAATITGRVVNGEGNPVGRAQIELHLGTDSNPAIPTIEIVQRFSDSNGRFELEIVPAGTPYILAMGSAGIPGGIAKRDLVVTAGQSIDLGEIDITKLESPEQKQAAKPSAAPVAVATRIHGLVIGPNGKPIAGAHVTALGAANRTRRGGDLDYRDDVLIETTTGEDGAYQFSLNGVSSKTHTRTAVIARADGMGLAWRQLDADARNVEASFKLVAEEPIRGRLIDIEGQPAGNVALSIGAVVPTTEGGNITDGVGFRHSEKAPAAWPQLEPTNDNGQFVIHGIPAGHGVFINVAGDDRFAPQDISLNTGMPEQRGERDGTYRSLVKNLKPGEEAVLALAPAQIFEGTVRYEDTKQPAPHARLTIWASQQPEFGSMVSVAGKADAQGRYHISPNPGIRFGVTAYPPDGAPYLTRRMPEVKWNDAAKTKQVDVTLPRGVLVRGKVLESGSNKPIANATIQYVPEKANNPHDADDILTGWQGIQLSNEQGEFEIVVLPGPGTLLVQGPQGEFVLRETSDRQLSEGRPGGRRNYTNAIERIDLAPVAEPLNVTITLQRGAKISGRLINEAGEPVDEALLVSQLFIHPTTLWWRGDSSKQVLGGQFELSPLDAAQKYTVHFLDAKHKFGATVTLGAEDHNATVVLKPCGQATAQFVDANGEPLADFRPELNLAVSPGAYVYDSEAMKRGELAADADFASNVDRINHQGFPSTDADGRITYSALIPGATYRIIGTDHRIAKEFTVEPSQSLDLGQIVIERND